MDCDNSPDRVDCRVMGQFNGTQSSCIQNSIGTVTSKKIVFLIKQVTCERGIEGFDDSTLVSDQLSQPDKVCVSIDLLKTQNQIQIRGRGAQAYNRCFMLVRINDIGFWRNGMIFNQPGVMPVPGDPDFLNLPHLLELPVHVGMVQTLREKEVGHPEGDSVVIITITERQVFKHIPNEGLNSRKSILDEGLHLEISDQGFDFSTEA